MELTTHQLLEFVKASPITVEAEIRSNGLRATHWLAFFGGRFHHEGIDGERHRTSYKRMMESYPNTIWSVSSK